MISSIESKTFFVNMFAAAVGYFPQGPNSVKYVYNMRRMGYFYYLEEEGDQARADEEITDIFHVLGRQIGGNFPDRTRHFFWVLCSRTNGYAKLIQIFTQIEWIGFSLKTERDKKISISRTHSEGFQMLSSFISRP